MKEKLLSADHLCRLMKLGITEPVCEATVLTSVIVGVPDKGRKYSRFPDVDLTIERDDRGEFVVHIEVLYYSPPQKSTGRDTDDDPGYVEFGVAFDDDGKSVTLTEAEIEAAERIVFGV